VEKIINKYKILVGQPEGKRPLGRSRHKWVDIRMNVVELALENVNWVHLA
jgi:hypothetical protein